MSARCFCFMVYFDKNHSLFCTSIFFGSEEVISYHFNSSECVEWRPVCRTVFEGIVVLVGVISVENVSEIVLNVEHNGKAVIADACDWSFGQVDGCNAGSEERVRADRGYAVGNLDAVRQSAAVAEQVIRDCGKPVIIVYGRKIWAAVKRLVDRAALRAEGCRNVDRGKRDAAAESSWVNPCQIWGKGDTAERGTALERVIIEHCDGHRQRNSIELSEVFKSILRNASLRIALTMYPSSVFGIDSSALVPE